MHSRHARHSIVLTLLIAFGFAATAFAQGGPRLDVSGGWQMLRPDDDTRHGWYGDVAVNLNRVLALVGQVDGVYTTLDESGQSGNVFFTVRAETQMHAGLGGARLSLRAIPRVEPFAQFLVGAVRLSATSTTSIPGFLGPATFKISQTEPVLQIGGGVTLGLSRSLGVRIAVDHRRVFLEEETGTATRVATGLVLRF